MFSSKENRGFKMFQKTICFKGLGAHGLHTTGDGQDRSPIFEISSFTSPACLRLALKMFSYFRTDWSTGTRRSTPINLVYFMRIRYQTQTY